MKSKTWELSLPQACKRNGQYVVHNLRRTCQQDCLEVAEHAEDSGKSLNPAVDIGQIEVGDMYASQATILRGVAHYVLGCRWSADSSCPFS